MANRGKQNEEQWLNKAWEQSEAKKNQKQKKKFWAPMNQKSSSAERQEGYGGENKSKKVIKSQ